MHSYMQTKAVSLALESKYIRKQEQRFRKKSKLALADGKDRRAAYFERNREGQYLHRIGIVRDEARITNITRGFFRGKEYSDVERIAYSKPNWLRIENLVMTYGERDNPKFNQTLEERWAEWLKRAKNYYTGTVWSPERIREVCPLKPKKPYTGPKHG